MPKAFTVAGELLLDTGQFRSSVGGAGAAASMLIGRLGRLGDILGPGSQLFAGAAKNIAKAGVSFLAARKSLDIYITGAERAKKTFDADYELTVAISREGEDPEDLARRLAKLKTLAFDVSKKVSGTKSDVQLAIAAGLQSGISEGAMLRGMGRTGADYADATGQDKVKSMRQIAGFYAGFKDTHEPEQIPLFADLLVKGAKASRFRDAGAFAHEMEFAAPKLGAMGLSPEDTAAWVALVGGIQTMGAGRSLRTAASTLVQPEKQKKLKKYGLDEIFDEEGLRPLVDIERIVEAKLGGYSKKKKQSILGEIFGTEAATPFLALLTGDAAALREDMLSRGGVAYAQGERAKTPGFQEEAAKGTAGTGYDELFRPAAKWRGDMWEWLNTNIITPSSGFVVEHEGVQKGVSGAAGGLAVGLGGLATAYTAKGLYDAGAAVFAGRGKGIFGFDAVSVGKGMLMQTQSGGRINPVVVVNFDELVSKMGGAVGPVDVGKLPGGQGVGDTVATVAGYKALTTGASLAKKAAPTAGRLLLPAASAAAGATATAGAAAWPVAAGVVAALYGGAVGYGLNVATREDMAAHDTARGERGVMGFLAGEEKGGGERQINVFQAGMAHAMAFFGDEASTRFLAQRDVLNSGGTLPEAFVSGDAAVRGELKQAAEKQSGAAAELESAAIEIKAASIALAIAVDELRRAGGSRGDMTSRGAQV